MIPSELRDQVLLLNADSLINFIEANKNEIRLTFLLAATTSEVQECFQDIVLKASQLQLSEADKNTIQIQSFITHLAFYFKKIDNRPLVETYNNILEDSVFKRRIEAWLYQRRYHNFKSHISLFKRYLKKLSDSRYDDDDDYIFELLDDLFEYQNYASSALPASMRSELAALFDNVNLQEEFPILFEYTRRDSIYVPSLQTESYNEKQFEPTTLAELAFNDNFLSYIKAHSPGYPQQLLGYTKDEVINSIIKKGQANFDQSYQALTPEQIVKLYCYFNMRMHFYSSLSLFERSHIVSRFYNSAGKIKFIDLGCGPGTSGLALIDCIHTATGYPVVLDYFGVDSSRRMRLQAKDMIESSVIASGNILKFYGNVSEIDMDDLNNNTCIIVNACYLFASPSLQIDDLVDFFVKLKDKYPFRPIYLFFQNPEADFLNENYVFFKTSVGAFEVDFTKSETIYYHNVRNSYFPPKKIHVYFEILKF